MTAITLNLLAEEQLAHEASARDPLKHVIAFGVGLVALTVLTGSLLLVAAGKKRTEVKALEQRLESIKTAQATGKVSGFQAVKSQADDILKVNHSRVLFAPQLALVKDLVPDNIQLRRLRLDISTETHQPDAIPSADEIAGGGKRRVVAAKSVEKLVMQLEGKAMSTRPEIEVDKFINMLRADPAFSEHVQHIQLRSIARAGGSTETGAVADPAAYFVIDFQYKERK